MSLTDICIAITHLPIPKPRMYFKRNSGKLDSKPTKPLTKTGGGGSAKVRKSEQIQEKEIEAE